ncbi:antirestriction protein ArdA (plasmid) [Limosilactobacillus reuteri]|uniref:Antirestriction protein ArdA n=1 Tax=Limosilactobacillus reuteri TaxID=1598 RepID=A0A517D8L4_LIMRT|nr:antirestriction protein ArdA [Limosilactobacillus reuteri]QDR73701.1 antirestriction protein ArdA [Limosilactobacillus reuteri]
MKISIYVSNLAMYNDGILNGHWTDLPVDDVNADILDKLDLGKDSQGNYCHDWFVSDYEAPFKISEYEDLYQLNQLAAALADYETMQDVYNSLDDPYQVSDCETIYEWDGDEIVNMLFEQACAMCNEKCTPANIIIHDMIDNFTDDYIYLNDLAQVKTMSQYQADSMYADDADEIIAEFAKENLQENQYENVF